MLSSVIYNRKDEIAAQMQVLNNAFHSASLYFDLVKVTFTMNANWFDYVQPGSLQETAMKTLLRPVYASAAELYLYTVGWVL